MKIKTKNNKRYETEIAEINDKIVELEEEKKQNNEAPTGNFDYAKKWLIACVVLFIILIVLVVLLNLFLPQIVVFFMAEKIDLLPIRLYSLVPLIVGISGYIASNLMIALGYNKYILYSILVTTTIYLFLLGGMYWGGRMNSVISFVWLTFLSYLGELIYRLIIGLKIIKNETDRKSKGVLPEK